MRRLPTDTQHRAQLGPRRTLQSCLRGSLTQRPLCAPHTLKPRTHQLPPTHSLHNHRGSYNTRQLTPRRLPFTPILRHTSRLP